MENLEINNYRQFFETSYRGKKIFVTGHTGFKGSWLLAWLHRLGAIVKGYALAPQPEHSLYRLLHGDSLCTSVIADIRDKERLQEEIISFQPDFIFHLAAQPLVRSSYEMPLYTFEVNVNGTAHLLEAMRVLQNPCSAVIITTDKVYENREADYAYREDDKLGGYDPYSASKAAAEIVVSSYRSSFFHLKDFDRHKKAIATARAGNVIGGGDFSKDRIVPDIVRALQSNNPVVIRNPSAVRPWQHVLEPLSGYLLLAAMLQLQPAQYAGAWNFGPRNDDAMTVEELVKTFIQNRGGGGFKISKEDGQPHEAGLLQLDISKAKKHLNWEPKLDIKKTLAWVAEEYKALAAGRSEIIFQHIEQYAAVAHNQPVA